VRQTINDTGVVLGSTNADPWGQPQRATIAPFGFTGELQQGSSVYLRARWYNSANGAFGTFRWRTEESSDVIPFSHHGYQSYRWQTSEAFFTKPYNLHPYQYAYSNPVLHTDPTGMCVPDEDSPRACNPTFTRSIRDFLQYSYRYENRNYRGGDPINLILDRFAEEARSYQPKNDQNLLAFLNREGFDVDATTSYLNIRLTQWRQDYAQQNNVPMPDLGPLASGLFVLGSLTGGLDCFLSPDGGGGGGTGSFAAGSSSRWTRTTAPWQRRVYQRSDIDWDFVRPTGTSLAGRTNREAAAKGYAPVRVNPQTSRIDDVILHHTNQDPRGAVVELWRSTHGSVPHKMDPPGSWRQTNPEWAKAWQREQSAYWRWRAGEYNPAPTDRLRLPGDP